ncbi:MAG: O-antigen ligase family protein [Chloroflexi bacterium]|nr:O-antigen ligase family protein [Chloroflexota bacterium]
MWYIVVIPVALAIGTAVSLLPTLLAFALVGMAALVLIFLSNARVAVLALLGARASIDVLQERSLFSAGGQLEINAAAAMGFGIVLLGSYYILANRINPLDNSVAIAYVAFLIIGLIGFMFSRYPATVLADWMRAASLLIIFTLVYHLFQTKEDIVQVLWAIGLSSVLPVVMGSFQFASGGGVSVEGFDRVYGTFVVPPIYAFYLVLLGPLLGVILANTHQGWARAALAAWLVFVAVNLFATYTRGAWIGAGLALLAMGALRFRKLLLVLPVAAIIILVAVPQVADRFADLGYEKGEVSYKEANTLAWRTKYWREKVLGLEGANLLVGAGLGTIRKANEMDAHNDYLRLFVETGAIGLLSYLVVLATLVNAAWRAWRNAADSLSRDIAVAFLAVYVAYVVMSFADNIVLNPELQWYFWSQAAVVLVIANEGSRRVAGPHPNPLPEGEGTGAGLQPSSSAIDGMFLRRKPGSGL